MGLLISTNRCGGYREQDAKRSQGNAHRSSPKKTKIIHSFEAFLNYMHQGCEVEWRTAKTFVTLTHSMRRSGDFTLTNVAAGQ
jgi:hypothetical protein